ncbi:hypothetical protein M6D81_08140 [Paenibacillus sp. J5C_2022]|uniref:hypothetical protein n=1 Tax=Paenibacillus sp. J5C2022 TaxID=2977129 RepID=UPI0021CFE646|nr:hypothetical protein [Paenibacillus sp. J5C2022]MCU6708686.1 hypothetical protein [Paenibacillus sp. J5C2022]
MDYYLAECATEMYMRNYMEFLLENYTELKLPYSFPVAFSYLASPVLLSRESFLCFNEEDEVIGAFGYIHGTGEHDYEDVHVIQLQVAYIKEGHRRTRLFLEGLRYLSEYLAERDEGVREIRFWTGEDAYSERLFSKFARQTARVESERGILYGYNVAVPDLQDYIARFQVAVH